MKTVLDETAPEHYYRAFQESCKVDNFPSLLGAMNHHLELPGEAQGQGFEDPAAFKTADRTDTKANCVAFNVWPRYA